MIETNKKSYLNLIAGGLFALLALDRLSLLLRGYFSFDGLLWFAGYVLAAVMLFIGGRNILPAVGFSLRTLMTLYGLVMYGGNLIGKLMSFLELLAYVAMVLLIVAVLTDALPNLAEVARKLWFVPGALMVLRTVIYIGMLHEYFFYEVLTQGFLFKVIEIIGLFLAGLWAAYPNGLTSGQAGRPQNTYGQNTYGQPAYSQGNTYAQPSYSQTGQSSDGYIGMARHVLLLLLTFGIWNLIWIYRTTGYLNRVEDEPPRIPVNKLLLCMFVPFYSIYWTYQSTQRVDKLAARNGVASDLTTLCLILAIFVPIIPPILMQDKINAIASGGGASQTGTGYTASQQPRQAPRAGGIGTAEELKAYKELLDSGAITQEEYEAKKRQLLDL